MNLAYFIIGVIVGIVGTMMFACLAVEVEKKENERSDRSL